MKNYHYRQIFRKQKVPPSTHDVDGGIFYLKF